MAGHCEHAVSRHHILAIIDYVALVMAEPHNIRLIVIEPIREADRRR